MENQIELNQNQAECIKETYNFNGTDYVNICNGKHTFVANGFWDYTVGVGGIAFVILILVIIYKIIKE